MPKHDDGHSRLILKVIENWLTIISSVLQSEFRIFIANRTDDEFRNGIIEVISQILEPYEDTGNLTTWDVTLAIVIYESVEIVLWFQRNGLRPDSRLVRTVLTITHGLRLGKRIILRFAVYSGTWKFERNE